MSFDNNLRQSREWIPCLLLIIVLVAFWMTASIVDVALWTPRKQWPVWMSRYFDHFWLTLHAFFLPLLIVMILKPRLTAFLAFFTAAFLGSVAWDLIYSWLTRGRLISDSMVRWFVPDYDNPVRIGVTEAGALWFYIARVVIGLMLLYALCVRIKRHRNLCPPNGPPGPSGSGA